MSNETAKKKETSVPEVEVVSHPDDQRETPAPRSEPLPDDAEIDEIIQEAAADIPDEDAGPLIDEGLLEHTCHQVFDLYQKTGNHEVRRLAMLVGQMGASILGADPREFFPDAPPIRDAGAPAGAPTFPGQPQPGWPAAHEQHGPQAGNLQPVLNANGQPAFQPLPMGVPAGGGPQHVANPSGAEMRVVNDPTGTMQTDGQPPAQYMPQAPGMPPHPGQMPQQGQPQRRRRRRR